MADTECIIAYFTKKLIWSHFGPVENYFEGFELKLKLRTCLEQLKVFFLHEIKGLRRPGCSYIKKRVLHFFILHIMIDWYWWFRSSGDIWAHNQGHLGPNLSQNQDLENFLTEIVQPAKFFLC